MAFSDLFKRKVEPAKTQKRYYSAAGQNRLLNDFVGSERSADSELRPALRSLRARSRDLARNNEYVKRYFELLKANVVGDRGFTLQVKARSSSGDQLDVDGNSRVENAFKTWGKLGNASVDGKMTWIDVQKMAIESLARDGEIIAIKHRGNNFHDTFSLEFLEADQLDDEKNERLSNGNEIRMGVEMDKFRKPVAYHFITYHPGDYDWANKPNKQHIRITADRVLHVFIQLRAGQTRGEPWLAPSINAIKHLSGFSEAAVINARIGASKMGFFTSPAGDGFVPDDIENNVPIMDAEPGTFHQLPQGVGLEKFDPAFPSNEFADFHKAILKSIASGMGVSYTSLANDLEATSYSSIRQGALEERDYYRNLQCFLLDHFIRPVFEGWLRAAMEVDSFGIPVAAFDKFADAAQFRGKAWSWVDPQKEMAAAILGLQSGVLSLQDVASQYGKDVEELLAQIDRDKDMMQQFGVDYALEPYFNPKSTNDNNEDQADRGLNEVLQESLKRAFLSED